MKGTGTFILGTGGLFLLQKVLQRKLPYALQWNLLVSTAAASVASYSVTRWETQKCTDLWILLETGSVPDRTPPQIAEPHPEQPSGPRKTQYGDVMD